MHVRPITTEECLPLRARVLRPGLPESVARYELDPECVHFGAFEGEALVAVVTAHAENFPGFFGENQWRIRGMAAETARQSRGYGGEVLRALLAWGRLQKIPLFWCNARERAIPFYQRHGFTVESEFFDIPGIGPHKVMKIEL